MAEPFGIAAGTIGIAAAFNACVDCFQYIQLGRNFGQDLQTELLALNCSRLRLTRWGEAVDIYSDARAREGEVEVVRETLGQILELFARSEEISRRYASSEGGGEAEPVCEDGNGDGGGGVRALNTRLKELALNRRRKHGRGVLKTAHWALHHRSQLRELIQDITRLVEHVERLFPAPEQRLSAAVGQEIAQLDDDDGHDRNDDGGGGGRERALELVRTAAGGNVDPLLEAAVKEELTGHKYLNVSIEGKGQTGDAFAADWKGQAVGPSHTYDGVKVEKGGKALVGNKYGGKDFWDSD